MRTPGSRLLSVLMFLGPIFTGIGQELLPLPSELPVLSPLPDSPVRQAIPVRAVPPQRQLALPQFNRPLQNTNTAPRPYQPLTVGDDILRWDATEKEHRAQPGEQTAYFSYSVTNVSKSDVVINHVRPSCGCTVAKLPPTPWTLKPGESGTIELSLDLRGKVGTLSKFTSVDTSHGQRFLSFRAYIPQQPLAQPGMDSRTRNMQLAMVDRQVVFRGDCAKCHSEPTIGKVKGEELYSTACAICHDAPHRATMVPDLRALKKATGPEYWKAWIMNGKPGTLMPGFAKGHGGPLSDEQIDTLAKFMFDKFPRSEAAPVAASGAAPGNPAVPSTSPTPAPAPSAAGAITPALPNVGRN